MVIQCELTDEHVSERIAKIGQYLIKLYSYEIWWLVFYGPPCVDR